jgi:hypothetical protein
LRSIAKGEWEGALVGVPVKGDYGNDAGCLAFVIGEVGAEFDLFGIDGVTLGAGDRGGCGFVLFATYFDGDDGVGDEVEVPLRVGRGAALGGEYVDAIVAFEVGDGVGAGESGFGTHGVEEDELLPGAASDGAAVQAEFVDDFGVVGVEFASVGHGVRAFRSGRVLWVILG